MSYHRCRWVSDHATSGGRVLRSRGLVFGAALLMLVAGCSSSQSSSRSSASSSRSSSTPSPQLMCEQGPVEVGQTPRPPYPCSKADYDKVQSRLALEQQAIAVYREFNDHYLKLTREGGSDTPQPVFEKTLENPAKTKIYLLLFGQKQDGITAQGPPVRQSWRVIPNTGEDGSEVTLLTCDDNRGTVIYQKDGSKFDDGRVLVSTRHLKHFPDGSLRIFQTKGKLHDDCPF